MRITFLINSFGPGGKARQLLYLIQSIAESCSLQLMVFNENIAYPKELYDLPLDVVTIKKRERNSLKTALRVYKALKNFKPDVIHPWDNIPHCIALPYMAFRNVRVVNGSIRYAGKIERSMVAVCMQKIAFATSDVIVSNSRAGLAVENLLSSQKANYVHNGFDIASCTNNNIHFSETMLNIRKKFKYFVLMVARLDPAKDYKTFIQAARLVTEQNQDTAFLCLGDGPDRKKAEAEAGPLFDKKIFFLGHVNDVQQIIQASDIGVLLTNTDGHAEGISNVIMEYMALGLPVIATGAGGTPELVRDNVSGFLVPPFDPDIVAEKILLLLENVHVRDKMGKNGRKIIIDEFSLAKMVSSYLTLYKGLENIIR